jgi:copper homeostasis protein
MNFWIFFQENLNYLPMIIEIVAYSLESCLAAQKGGADRIELCGSPFEGGTTPSAGLLQSVKQSVSLPVHVMIRPRGGDFCYNSSEIQVMKSDITFAKQLGADSLVLGVLNPDGTVDENLLQELVSLAQPLPVTFHRAFDMTPDPFKALETLISCKINCILTSGQQNKAFEGKSLIEDLVKQAQRRIKIMAGSGVNIDNVQQLVATGIDALHLSGRATRDSAMIFRKQGIAMGGLPQISEYEIAFTDWHKVREICNAVK